MPVLFGLPRLRADEEAGRRVSGVPRLEGALGEHLHGVAGVDIRGRVEVEASSAAWVGVWGVGVAEVVWATGQWAAAEGGLAAVVGTVCGEAVVAMGGEAR